MVGSGYLQTIFTLTVIATKSMDTVCQQCGIQSSASIAVIDQGITETGYGLKIKQQENSTTSILVLILKHKTFKYFKSYCLTFNHILSLIGYYY